MSDPIQCFMLEVVERETAFVCASLKSELRGGSVPAEQRACPKMPGRLHRAEIQVPVGFGLSNVFTGADDTLYVQLSDKRVQLCCDGCGMAFKADESDAWSSHPTRWYRNPRTGKEGSNAYQVGSPGAIYSADWLDDEEHMSDLLSDYYRQQWRGRRKPLTVVLPDNTHWVVDQKSTIRGQPNQWGPGWTITGDAPYLTASPSIDTNTYHGFLQSGVLTPDLEGRTYTTRT